MKKGKRFWLFASVFELLLCGSCTDRLFDNPLDPDADRAAYEILATIPLSGVIPADLTFSRDSLWTVDLLSRVLSLNYNSGMVIRELEVEKRVNGIAYDTEGLWLSVKGSPQIFKISMVQALVIKTLDFTRGDFGPLDYFGGKLYIGDRLTNSILVVNPVDGQVEKSIPNPGFSLNGVTFDGTNLWTIDAQQMRIYRMTAEGAVVIYYQTPGKSAAGLCQDSGVIWCGDGSGRIFKLRFQ